ncbi:FecCD family ABC transporter permease [Austwickia chelonae]|uniref:FecCD family ABC transporter permease n=1 Tax=Austwickia chelonae TaxID=100225 RepID=UPI000E2680F4|nr:iron ABC transporter permease [Austwickia chelonae]
MLTRLPRPGTVGTVLVSSAVLAVLVLASLAVGSHHIPLGRVIAAFTAYDASLSDHVLVRDLRVPRTGVAVVVGAALGAAGALTQAVTRNPLAEPGFLGISAGAAVVVALGLVVMPHADVATMILFSFAGAATSGIAVLLLGGAFRETVDPVRLVLAGAALSVVLSAVTGALVINNRAVFESFRYWDSGAVAARPWPLIVTGTVITVLGIVLGLIAAPGLNALALGSELGRAVGASPLLTWSLAGIAVVLLAGTATAIAGPISFVGLAAPMIVRSLLGPDQRRLVPVSALVAADALLLADVLGRAVVPPQEVQASVVCAVIGAPIFIAFARRRRLDRL